MKPALIQTVNKAITRDMQDMARDFNRQVAGGFCDIKMTIEASHPPIKNYSEQSLETHIECNGCTHQYAVFGVFAFCPDCRQHNSLQMLIKNLEVIEKMLTLASASDLELKEKLTENALEDCVSTFDGFGREICRVNANKSKNPTQAVKLSFQNLEAADSNLTKLFGLGLARSLDASEWVAANRGFQKRHLLAHRMGVIDAEYVAKANDPDAVAGRKVHISSEDVGAIISAVHKMATHLSRALM